MEEKIKRLSDGSITDAQLKELIEGKEYQEELIASADKARRRVFGTSVYIRGLIEFTNYCKNDCLYCGIRRSNLKATRYRLTKDEILACCESGYDLGFRTFVLQGGEDPFFTTPVLCDIVSEIRKRYPDCAITLSVGEKSREDYRALKVSGADRYLLRHETATPSHYKLLHTASQSLENRKRCLYDLKAEGFQVGSGFMVGSLYQRTEHLVADLRFLQELQPDMIGIGPFLSHAETPFAGFENGDLDLCLRMIAILRLMFPLTLLPSTTAMGTLHPEGRLLGLSAGANVVMPNLSPARVRDFYKLYDHKAYTGAESAQGLAELEKEVERIGCRIVSCRGDAPRKDTLF